ncbi:unnamed protein product, partial [Mesorhabditis belari]|uniref:C-type lectin domain-containing protein n=1 Tax=Mesorhabditis belari TaxID=2138241 RepID=A0AAF3EH69_9BILA
MKRKSFLLILALFTVEIASDDCQAKLEKKQKIIEELKEQLMSMDGNNDVTMCDDWTKYQGKFYKLIPVATSHKEAEEVCQKQGAQLVSIHSDEEANFVLDLGLDPNRNQNFHLGLSKNGDKWSWSDGTEMNYTKWDSSQGNDFKWAVLPPSKRWYKINDDDWGQIICKRAN